MSTEQVVPWSWCHPQSQAWLPSVAMAGTEVACGLCGPAASILCGGPGLGSGQPTLGQPQGTRGRSCGLAGSLFAVMGLRGRDYAGDKAAGLGAPRETVPVPCVLDTHTPTCGQRQHRVSCLGTCGRACIAFLHCPCWPSLDQALGGAWGASGRPLEEHGQQAPGRVWRVQNCWASRPGPWAQGARLGRAEASAVTATVHGPGHTLLQGHTESPPGPPKDPIEGHLPGGQGGAGPRLGVGLTGR